MKFIIDKSNEKVIKVSLEDTELGLGLKASKSKGDSVIIGALTTEGELCLFTGIPEKWGFKTDANGYIKIRKA